MEAILQPGACWLVIVDYGCTVLRVASSRDKCLLPGETDQQPLDCVQEWLAPVLTPAMVQCSRCLSTVAEELQPDNCTDLRKSLPNATDLPRPQSFWIASINGTADVLQVVENGVRLPGYRETYPLEQVRVWILPVWSPEMAYCPGCAQAKPRRDILFFFRNALKGVCKSCSERFDIDAGRESAHS